MTDDSTREFSGAVNHSEPGQSAEEMFHRTIDCAKASSGHPSAENDAAISLAVLRSQALMNFYSAERRAGATPLEANERMHFFAKRLDARSPFEIEQEAVAAIMESVS